MRNLLILLLTVSDQCTSYYLEVGLFKRERGLILFQARFFTVIVFTFRVEIILPLGCIICLTINLFFLSPTCLRRKSFLVRKVSSQSDVITKWKKMK